jgi:hypothetical protein
MPSIWPPLRHLSERGEWALDELGDILWRGEPRSDGIERVSLIAEGQVSDRYRRAELSPTYASAAPVPAANQRTRSGDAGTSPTS